MLPEDFEGCNSKIYLQKKTYFVHFILSLKESLESIHFSLDCSGHYKFQSWTFYEFRKIIGTKIKPAYR